MKRVLPLLSLLTLAALPVIAKPAARKAAAKPASVICGITTGWDGGSTLNVIAAFRGKRWVSSEEAVGLLHEGDHLPLCTPQGSLVGEVTLEDRGRRLSEAESDSQWAVALEFQASVQENDGAPQATAGFTPTRFATWSRDLPLPRWVRWTELPKPAKGSPYWRVAADWVRSRRLPKRALETIQFTQAARADVNGDGKDEVFLSFSGSGGGAGANADRRELKPYTCLLMRRVLPGGKAETVVLDHTSLDDYWVTIAGFCDLDHDGWAEVIVSAGGAGIDGARISLYRWNGRRFVNAGGYAFGS
jgi:hypothetical protein